MTAQQLARRVGELSPDRWEAHGEEHGAAIRREVDRLLPADWVWEGKRALDFGSGAGRALRHFGDLVPHNTFWGCDVHGQSIDWLNEHLAPMRGLVCGRAPGLPLSHGSLDLVWATSVFSHLRDHWSGWLLELHRLLAPGGILIAAFLGDESFDVAGPKLLLSPWWTCARWRRAFDILRVEPSGFMGGHGVVVVRKRPSAVTITDRLPTQVRTGP